MQNNKATPSVANTLRDPAQRRCAGTNFDLRQFRRVGDTITVNGTDHHLRGVGRRRRNQINITDSIATLLAKIDAITGTAIPSDDHRRLDHAAFRHGRQSLGLKSATPRRSPRSASPAP